MLCINILQQEHFPSICLVSKKNTKADRIGAKITGELGVFEKLKEAVKKKIK